MRNIQETLKKLAPKTEYFNLDGDPPKEQPIFNCEKHGQQEGSYMIRPPFRGDEKKYRINTTCKLCSQDRLEAEREKERLESLESDKRILLKMKLNAGLSPRTARHTFDSFVASNDKQQKVKECAMKICDMVNSGEDVIPNMIINGSVGTGKTMLAAAMINNIIEFRHSKLKRGESSEIITAINLIRSLKATWAKDSETSEQELIKLYIRMPLLVIDEVGIQFDTDTEKLFMFDIIDGRYQNMVPTVLISNLGIEGIKGCIGERGFDRLREDGGKLFALDFESQRGKKLVRTSLLD